jgi:ATP-binding protein involved in chromosome partitioning
MRGPIASRVITQLMSATEWGTLDYLIVDMPPGEGDGSAVTVRAISVCVWLICVMTLIA